MIKKTDNLSKRESNFYKINEFVYKNHSFYLNIIFIVYLCEKMDKKERNCCFNL